MINQKINDKYKYLYTNNWITQFLHLVFLKKSYQNVHNINQYVKVHLFVTKCILAKRQRRILSPVPIFTKRLTSPGVA